jgi:hypothetical protein
MIKEHEKWCSFEEMSRKVDAQNWACKSFDRSIIAIRIAINRLVKIIEDAEDSWILYEILMHHKNVMHTQIDLLIREKKRYQLKNVSRLD